ncbi:TolC family protein [Zwartia sp.]|uniref:TolC family protein n=1 Tax=Zwartia sp. TaxID=2978004 RepID=UPI00272458B7|nr:TolC family protein [Zwartia sp.]MDO9023115.1 TolC family protein [Zwartia sp.]
MSIAKMSALAGICLLAAGCSIKPTPISMSEQDQLLKQDRLNAYKDVEPVGMQMTLNEAVARGLKYNLEHRSKMMEQAIALGASELSNYDMLPKVVANAGYNYRNNYFVTEAVGYYSGNPSLSEPFVNSSRQYWVGGAMLSWNILDFGVGYYAAKQNADKVLVASEKRRRVMHLLVQDIQIAYLRAASAQKLKDDILKTIKSAEVALRSSKQGKDGGDRSPLDAMRYQKALLDNMKILETIDQELSTAKIELNQLINVPANSQYMLEDPDKLTAPHAYAKTSVEEFEVRALAHNADLKEGIYNARIAMLETRKSMLRLLPGLSFNYGPQASNNTYYINKNWMEGAAQISFNLWNLLLAPQVKQQALANEDLATNKRMLVQMAVVSQVYLSKMQLDNAYKLYQRSVDIEKVDLNIARITRNNEREGAASQAERVAADASAILSRLRKYQALSQLFAASARLQATAGLEPDIGSVDDIKLQDLSDVVKQTFSQWNSGQLPLLELAVAEKKQ